MAKINVFTGGTAATQLFTATDSGWVHAGAISANDIFVQAGVTTVAGTADALYKAAPQLFAPHQVDQSPL